MSSLIKDYQAANGLTADGVIGKKTLEHIKHKLNIKTNEGLVHFIGQIAHESTDFTRNVENLNYSEFGLLTTFKKYFKTPADTIGYVKQPQKIANKVYANRMGNDTEASGEPAKYIGRGGLQLTGKDNYKAFGDSIGVDLVSQPELVATKYFFESAKWFFDTNKLWSLTTKVDDDSIKKMTKCINGGYNGLNDRIESTKHYYNIINKAK